MNDLRKAEAPTIALFGGSFNPPHVVHAMVCLYLLQTGAEAVWLVPTFKHAFAKGLAPFEARIKMCRLMAAPLGDRVRVLDIEAHRDGPSYTIDTVRALQAMYPERSFSWVIGSDILGELHLWEKIEELKRRVAFRVLDRGGYTGPGAGVVFPALSSTEIREALARGDGAEGRVPLSVLTYIHRHGLYGAPLMSGDPC